ncbi:RagB/SusD family nutrient uptake outer membrane protein [Bacteroides heparinolyticus]|uniref:RagB/SusD family nutrient uptake outer membrane protein n=2 Tax=Prevotella heparinolytica TaxID=28113 RepID=A0A3P1ZX05_9BACE|nr:RagB/SusD family nutrient uptake outer membrane protein [Bacteroides heparinolyticus]RRD86660.1 RagB/SusD family nutrient uptake outer membrane protein [Bacteroides heparinolyticus]
MKAKHYTLILASLFTLGTTSCEDKLDIPQKGVLDYSSYYRTDVQAQTAADALYIQLKSTYYNYTMLKSSLSDDVWAGGGGRNDNAQLEGCNEYSFGSDQDFIRGVWESYYSLIYKANVILGHVKPDSDIKKKACAEAHFFRAFAYFDLISMWGEVPLVDHELTSSEYQIAKSFKADLWNLVETDLTEAISSGYLEEKKDVNDNTTWRITKQVAQTMLGKAYLWQEKYEDAAKVLNEVRSSGKYALYQGDYQNILTYLAEGNCESMLESNRIFDPSNAWDEFSFYEVMNHWRMDKLAASSPAFADYKDTGWGFMVPQKSLYDAFVAEEGVDGYRLNQTMKTYEQMTKLGVRLPKGNSIINEGYFLWKRRYSSSEAPITFWCSYNNYRWMRYAEVLLLAAEANLKAGKQAEADACLNEVRTRAKLPAKTADMAAIKLEKRLELCCEYTRYQDIIRWKDAEALLKDQGSKTPLLINKGMGDGPDNVVVEYKQYNTDHNRYGFKSKHYLLPIPATEMRLNPKMKQNEGW